jgi:hypothetical protein
MDNNPMKKTIPLWITIVCSLMTLLGIFVGCSLYVSPGTFIPDTDFSTAGTRYLANMWAARQIALASIIGISTFKKSAPMLQISLLAYSIMNVQDAVIGFNRSDMGLMIGATLFAAGPAYMAYRLRKNGRG